MLFFSIGRVFGNSMSPRICPDSFIISVKLPRWIPKKVGQMYYIEHPRYGKIVKTLAHIEDSDTLWFKGESAASVSSAAIGAMTHQQIIGKVLWVIGSPQKDNRHKEHR